jgi:2-polyprenyl-6-methoxyphenol hydroxylase-like FAD-dependent oxidoreductase
MTSALTQQHPVVVVGGGIGGVAMALALGRQGHRVQLLEQADQIGAIGYGVQMGPNVMPMLDELGVGAEVRAAAYFPKDIMLYDYLTGQTLSHIPLQTTEFAQRYQSQPYIAIHRVDMHELLLKACEKYPHISLNQSTTVTGYTQTGDVVSLHTAQGDTIQAAAVVACDGLRSRLRAQMRPDDLPRESGYVAHRSLIPMDQAPAQVQQRQSVTMWAGPGLHVIYYPLRQASLLNIVLVVQLPAHVSSTQDQGYMDYLQHLLAQAQPEPQQVAKLVHLDRRWAIADREPMRHWHDGRVCLLGDAAHATLQSLAQGAGMAIEDVVCLSGLMAQHGTDVSSAFKDFERARFLRTARVQWVSRHLWEDYHCQGVQAQVRSEIYSQRDVADHYRCLDWLWTPQALVS